MNLHELFHSRAIMHRQVYTHRCAAGGWRAAPGAGRRLATPLTMPASGHARLGKRRSSHGNNRRLRLPLCPPRPARLPRRKAKAVEFMVVDALLEADPALRLSAAASDPEQFVRLDDSVLEVRGPRMLY